MPLAGGAEAARQAIVRAVATGCHSLLHVGDDLQGAVHLPVVDAQVRGRQLPPRTGGQRYARRLRRGVWNDSQHGNIITTKEPRDISKDFSQHPSTSF